MELYQILLIVFVLFAESRVILQFKGKRIGVSQLLLWTCVWIVVTIFGLFAPYLWFISKWLGITRLADVFVYASIAILFYLMYRIYTKIESLDQEMTKLTRIITFKENEHEEKMKKK